MSSQATEKNGVFGTSADTDATNGRAFRQELMEYGTVVDSLRFDSHKLMFHPEAVSRWLSGEVFYPIYIEISPSGACNHRCTFCALDFMGYKPRFIDTAVLSERIAEMASLGVKSIMFGGEGEPLLHPDMAEIIAHTKRCGIDVALTTNGVLLTGEVMERVAADLSWIKVSINAGTATTYAALHRSRPEDFMTVLRNVSRAAGIIADLGSSCILGVQSILLPENTAEMEFLAEMARGAGAMYLVIKAYSQHSRSLTREYADLAYEELPGRVKHLQELSTSSFSVVVREHSMQKLLLADRTYGRCLALPFWSYVDAGGTVWGCSTFLGDERFKYGSLLDETFRQIWQGEQRRRSLEMVANCLDPESCRRNCRMDEINRYLWALTHPHRHVNFI